MASNDNYSAILQDILTRNQHMIDYEKSAKINFRLLELAQGEAELYLLELLQNALDAGATSISIKFSTNKMQFAHDNARRDEAGLTEEEVRAMSGVCVSSKSLSHIGFMGIGFKSVFKVYAKCTVATRNGWRYEYDTSERGLPGACLPHCTSTAADDFPYEHDVFNTIFTLSGIRDGYVPKDAALLPNTLSISQFIVALKNCRSDTLSYCAILALRGLRRLNLLSMQVNMSVNDDDSHDNVRRVEILLHDKGEPVKGTVICIERRIVCDQEAWHSYHKFRAPDSSAPLLPESDEMPVVRAFFVMSTKSDNDHDSRAWASRDFVRSPGTTVRWFLWSLAPTKIKCPFALDVDAPWLLTLDRTDLRSDPGAGLEWNRAIFDTFPALMRDYVLWCANNGEEMNGRIRLLNDSVDASNWVQGKIAPNLFENVGAALTDAPFLARADKSGLSSPAASCYMIKEIYNFVNKFLAIPNRAKLLRHDVVAPNTLNSHDEKFLNVYANLTKIDWKKLQSLWSDEVLTEWLRSMEVGEAQTAALFHLWNWLCFFDQQHYSLIKCIPSFSENNLQWKWLTSNDTVCLRTNVVPERWAHLRFLMPNVLVPVAAEAYELYVSVDEKNFMLKKMLCNVVVGLDDDLSDSMIGVLSAAFARITASDTPEELVRRTARCFRMQAKRDEDGLVMTDDDEMNAVAHRIVGDQWLLREDRYDVRRWTGRPPRQSLRQICQHGNLQEIHPLYALKWSKDTFLKLVRPFLFIPARAVSIVHRYEDVVNFIGHDTWPEEKNYRTRQGIVLCDYEWRVPLDENFADGFAAAIHVMGDQFCSELQEQQYRTAARHTRIREGRKEARWVVDLREKQWLPLRDESRGSLDDLENVHENYKEIVDFLKRVALKMEKRVPIEEVKVKVEEKREEDERIKVFCDILEKTGISVSSLAELSESQLFNLGIFMKMLVNDSVEVDTSLPLTLSTFTSNNLGGFTNPKRGRDAEKWVWLNFAERLAPKLVEKGAWSSEKCAECRARDCLLLRLDAQPLAHLYWLDDKESPFDVRLVPIDASKHSELFVEVKCTDQKRAEVSASQVECLIEKRRAFVLVVLREGVGDTFDVELVVRDPLEELMSGRLRSEWMIRLS